jgi:nucleotide-binding universal stress UspA family protein
MTCFGKIVACIEEGPARAAVAELAGQLAEHHRASLELLNIVPDVPWYARLVLPAAEEFERMLVQQHEQHLEALAAPIRPKGVPVTTRVLRGRVATEIAREVLRGEHDLLVKAVETGGDGGLGETTRHLLRECPCPVWLVRPGTGGAVRRVLAAVNPVPDDARHESLNARVLDLAAAVAEAAGAELHVAHAWHLPGEEMLRSRSEWVSREQVDAYLQDMEGEVRRSLDTLLERFPPRLDPARVHLVKGDPAEALEAFTAAHGIDVIVIGTVARAGVPGLVIGNTAEAVLRRVNCSVLTVKPEGFVSPFSAEATPAGAE